MSDEPSFDFLPWEELPVGVRRNRKKMYNYLVSVLGGDTPTPTGTGTVTVTGVDSEQNPVSDITAMLYTGDVPPSQQDDSMVVGYGTAGSNVVELVVYDTEQHQPTEETAIPFGTYTLMAMESVGGKQYVGSFTVDGDEEVTITLTSE